jgi:hypothetical protein
MNRYEGLFTALNIVLHRCLSLDIIIERYERPLTALPLAYHG